VHKREHGFGFEGERSQRWSIGISAQASQDIYNGGLGRLPHEGVRSAARIDRVRIPLALLGLGSTSDSRERKEKY